MRKQRIRPTPSQTQHHGDIRHVDQVQLTLTAHRHGTVSAFPCPVSLVSATSGGSSELLFKVHGHDDGEDDHGGAGTCAVRAGRVPRLAADSPFVALLDPAEDDQSGNPGAGESVGT